MANPMANPFTIWQRCIQSANFLLVANALVGKIWLLNQIWLGYCIGYDNAKASSIPEGSSGEVT
jgi:hypothetical protein